MSSPPTWLDLAARAEAGGDPRLSNDVWRKLGWRWGFIPGPWGMGLVGGWLGPAGEKRQDLPDLLRLLDAQEAIPAQIISTQRREIAKPKWSALAIMSNGCTVLGVGNS